MQRCDEWRSLRKQSLCDRYRGLEFPVRQLFVGRPVVNVAVPFVAEQVVKHNASKAVIAMNRPAFTVLCSLRQLFGHFFAVLGAQLREIVAAERLLPHTSRQAGARIYSRQPLHHRARYRNDCSS